MRALIFMTAAIIILAASCATAPGRFDRPEEAHPEQPPHAEDQPGTPEIRETPATSGPPPLPATSQEIISAIEARLPEGTGVLYREGKPLIARVRGGSVMGLAGSLEEVLVFSARPGEDEQYFHLEEAGGGCTVTSYRRHAPASVPDEAGEAYSALEALLACGGTEFSLFLLPRDDGTPLVVKHPFSAVSRSVLRDLTGDGHPELLRYSRLFRAEGGRELLLEAFRWDGRDFVALDSVALFARIDERYNQLEKRLLDASPDPGFLHRLDGALQPVEDAPPASSLFPVEEVLLPRVSDVPLRLGEAEWFLTREMSLDGHIYSFQLRLSANPLLAMPVAITGLDAP